MHPFENVAVPTGAVGIHWFGQSSFALKDTAGTIIQVDPYFPRLRPAENYIHAESPLDEATLRTDYVLLTHNHSDHTCIESLQRIHHAFPSTRFVAPAESITNMTENGLPTDLMFTISAGESMAVGSARVHAVWAKPPEGYAADGIAPPDVQHLGYVVGIGGVRVYVTGDPVHTFAEHAEMLDPIRELKPDIGLLTTHPEEGEFPFFDGSVKMAVKLRLKAAIPSHYACFVRRNYDPQQWAGRFPADGPEPIIIPYNSSIVYTP